MKITHAKTHALSIPMETGGPHGWGNEEWKELEFVLLEVTTDDGLTGWGEGWGYFSAKATAAMLDEIIAPQIIGRDARHISGISHDLLRSVATMGRGGPLTYAISAVDIALWDIAGKAAGLPVHRLLGGAIHQKLPTFASFFRFEDAGLVREMCSRALSENMCWLKLHEVNEDCVRAAREVAPDTTLILDVNCAWSPVEAYARVERLRQYQLHWLEEPIFPPEDVQSLTSLLPLGVPLALGENATSPFEFQRIIDAGTVSFLLPGVAKIGGITQVRKVLALAEAGNVTAIPYTPYHGPGLLASLHLMATLPGPIPVEFFYYTSIDGLIYGDALTPVDGFLSVPQSPGLGHDPDPDVLSRFAV